MSQKEQLVKRAKERAKKKEIDFDISVHDITLVKFCPILGIPLMVNIGQYGGRYNSPTLDRKDNAKGYTKDNVWVISQLANQMKSSATKEQLVAFADWIKEEYQ